MINELHAILKLHEQTLTKKDPALHGIRARKHKHEVFETFKVFQKEVENQLGKTIKSLCFDREGEYISQEFLDHLKDHGIITHRTPPYTPQHNGVSKRRNRTLLDMVRSMMSQTTLPKSFWDYALETDALILNMVSTKKVEKTPYKVWHRQAPKFTGTRHAPDRMCLYNNAEEHELGDLDEPANYKAALLDLNKWLFKKKTNMDGAVHTFKARLVAKGFTQAYGVDYEKTFSPVAEIRAIRILIAIAAYYVYEIWKIDVKTAFLNGHLSKENPCDLDWTTVKNIMKYVRNTKDMFLVYKGDIKRELRVSCYIGAGYLTDVDDLKF
uniref:Putative retrotransposon protein n=1 Tax=Tanacetum cinerariifolium TaxID=118510 RepID=A0A6L2KV15_TANCI|nr:putative retrotransposon protein [Tanacetum cinerariifolium]